MNKEIEKIIKKVVDCLDTAGEFTMPFNTFSRLPRNWKNDRYKSGNSFVLMLIRWAKGYNSNNWITFAKARELAEQQGDGKVGVKKGETSTEIIAWAMATGTRVDENGDEVVFNYPRARTWHVFNLEQTDIELNFDAYTPSDLIPAQHAEKLVGNTIEKIGVSVTRQAGQAYYSPLEHKVNVPEIDQFQSQSAYYGAWFHELAHATKKPLERSFKNSDFTSKEGYALEELVAESASLTIESLIGLQDENEERESAAYIKNWLQVLQNDPERLFEVGRFVEAVVDYIMGGQAPQSEGEAAE